MPEIIFVMPEIWMIVLMSTIMLIFVHLVARTERKLLRRLRELGERCDVAIMECEKLEAGRRKGTCAVHRTFDSMGTYTVDGKFQPAGVDHA